MDCENPYQSPQSWNTSPEPVDYPPDTVDRVMELVAKTTSASREEITLEASLGLDLQVDRQQYDELRAAVAQAFHIDPASLPAFTFGGIRLSRKEILQKAARTELGGIGISLATAATIAIIPLAIWAGGAAILILPVIGLIWLFYFSSGWRKLRRGDPEDVTIADLVEAVVHGGGNTSTQ